jgi:hypothetical protein
MTAKVRAEVTSGSGLFSMRPSSGRLMVGAGGTAVYQIDTESQIREGARATLREFTGASRRIPRAASKNAGRRDDRRCLVDHFIEIP